MNNIFILITWIIILIYVVVNIILPIIKLIKRKKLNNLNNSSKWKPVIGSVITASDNLLTIEVMTVWKNKVRVKVIEVDSFWNPNRFRQQNIGTGLVINEEFDISTDDSRSDWIFTGSKPWYSIILNAEGKPALEHYR